MQYNKQWLRLGKFFKMRNYLQMTFGLRGSIISNIKHSFTSTLNCIWICLPAQPIIYMNLNWQFTPIWFEIWNSSNAFLLFLSLFPLQLMDKECYRDIEKIKTIGSTYMAAVGLVPTTASKVHMQPLYLDPVRVFVFCLCRVLACFETMRSLVVILWVFIFRTPSRSIHKSSVRDYRPPWRQRIPHS